MNKYSTERGEFCFNCFFFSPSHKDATEGGLCCRYPPVGPDGSYPPVFSFDAWCGEWKAKTP